MEASGASLLLNAEAVLTMLVAAVMLAAGGLLAWEAGAAISFSPHALAVVGG